MISLADIAFLIIFFFMMTASFMRDKLVVALPSAAQDCGGRKRPIAWPSMPTTGSISTASGWRAPRAWKIT